MKGWLALLLAAMLTACSASGGAASSAPSSAGSSAVQEAPSQSQEEAPEEAPAADNTWQVDLPENHNMDPAVFEALHAALPGSGIHSVVTVKDGVIIDEYYEDGCDADILF